MAFGLTVIPATVTSVFDSGFKHIGDAVHGIQHYVVPAISATAEKAQVAWEFVFPALVVCASLVASRLGFGIALAAFSILPLHLSRMMQNKTVAISLFAVGVLAATTAGVLMCSSGLLPTLSVGSFTVIPQLVRVS